MIRPKFSTEAIRMMRQATIDHHNQFATGHYRRRASELINIRYRPAILTAIRFPSLCFGAGRNDDILNGLVAWIPWKAIGRVPSTLLSRQATEGAARHFSIPLDSPSPRDRSDSRADGYRWHDHGSLDARCYRVRSSGNRKYRRQCVRRFLHGAGFSEIRMKTADMIRVWTHYSGRDHFRAHLEL